MKKKLFALLLLLIFHIEVKHTGEGSLVGLAIHPDFPKKLAELL